MTVVYQPTQEMLGENAQAWDEPSVSWIETEELIEEPAE